MADRNKRKFWELMQKDVSVETLSSLFGKQNGTSEGSAALDTHAEDILEFATTEAQRRGRSVQEILAEMGYLVDPSSTQSASGPPPAANDETKRQSLLQSLDWVNKAQSTAPGPRSIAPARNVDPCDALIELLMPVDAEMVPVILDGLAPDRGAVRDKLAYLRVAGEDRLRHADVDARNGKAWWRALLDNGVPPQDLAEIVRSEPYFPPQGTSDETFREYLLDHDLVAWKDMKAAIKSAKESGGSYLEPLVKGAMIAPDAYFDALIAHTGWKSDSRPTRAKLTVALLSKFPVGWVHSFGVVPIAEREDELVVATTFQLQGKLLERLEAEVGQKIVVKLLSAAALEPLQTKYLDRWSHEVEDRREESPASSRMDDRQNLELKQAITQQSAVEIVRKLVAGALQARATDIHVEPAADNEARVRYRIDGILHEVLRLKSDLYDEVVARTKILADMDITERRRPQDGHISIEIHGKPYDLRIASIPAKGGEKVAIRLADAGRGISSLDQLGLDEGALTSLRALSEKPFGMVLATGPVGSGKTTTLYSCLSEVDRERNQVVSIEDPVEIELEGANQVEVNYVVGFDFSVGLRALLRQDPDVILVGEIRDEETAKIAVRASMTGLLVFSTLHTNDSTGAITALRNFHLPSHLIANSLQGVIAQRLLRKLCPHCKGPCRNKKDALEHLGLEALPRGFKHFIGKGCKSCFNTGYVGRTGVFELFGVDRAVRDMILEEASERSIRDYALEHGMDTLQDDGLRKIIDGVTSTEEFRRVLKF